VKAANSLSEPVRITGLGLHNLYTQGTLDIDATDWNYTGKVDINEGYNNPPSGYGDYKVLWMPTGSRDGHYDYMLAEADATVPAHTFNPLMLVSREQGMLVLPQTTKNKSDGTGDFYLGVSYQVSNYYDELKIPFSDLNGFTPTVANEGLTFEMGRQYALTLSFAENEAGGPVGVKFQLEVEDWDGKTEAYAATTVVFAENKPEGVTDPVTGIHDPNSNFIYGKELPELTGVPALPGYIFLGYYDSPDSGAKRYYDGTLVRQKYVDTDNDGDIDEFDIAVWDKAGPACTLYAQWGEEPYPFFAQSNIYFKPDVSGGSVGSLTFIEKGATLEQQGYQGLYFKWGSLIGVAAGGNGESYDATEFTGTYLYIPNRDTGKYYKVRAGAVSESYEDTNPEKKTAVQEYAGQISDNSWDKIPFVENGSEEYQIANIGNGRADDQLTDKSTATGLYQYYKGDICKFLSDNKEASKLNRHWVMPVSNDFGSDPDRDYKESGTWDNTVTVSTAPENGTSVIPDAYYTYTTASSEGVIFPAVGNRGGGTLSSVGVSGAYWSSSVNNTSYAYILNFGNSYAYPDDSFGPRSFGFPVRCVQEL
jgi:hypothetical protein